MGHGISGTAIDSITSYFLDRHQQVATHGEFSDPVALECGSPQGSKFASHFYKHYTMTLSLVIMDDSRLHTSARLLSASAQTQANGYLESAICDISRWMFANKLKLNSEKKPG